MWMWYDEKVRNQKVANEQQHQRRVWWENDRIIINNMKKKSWLPPWRCWWALGCSSSLQERCSTYVYLYMYLYIFVSVRMFRYCLLNEKHEWWKWKGHTFRRRFFILMKLLRNVKRTKFRFTKRWQPLRRGCDTKSWKVAIHLHFGWRQRLLMLSLLHVSDMLARGKSTADSSIEHNSRSNRIFASCKFLLWIITISHYWWSAFCVFRCVWKT